MAILSTCSQTNLLNWCRPMFV